MRYKIRNKFYSQFRKKLNLVSLKKSFFLLSLFYFFFYFLRNFSQISFDIDFKSNGLYILVSFFFCVLSIYLNAIAWENIVVWFGRIKTKNSFISFYVLTNILKYVPGGIWHFVERFYYLKDISNPQIAFYSTLIEPYFMLCASFSLSSLGAFFNPFYSFLIIPLIFLNRKLIYFVLRALESLKGKAFNALRLKDLKYRLEERIILTSFFPLKAFLFETAFILSKFVGFLFCLNTLYTVSKNDLVSLCVTFCISWSIGLIIPAAPSGAGVFEASFLFLAAGNIPRNIILVSLIYFRLISTLADIFLGGPFLMSKLFKKT